MGSALQVVAAKQYAPIMLFAGCPTNPMSNVFCVPDGYHAVAKLYELPTGWCLSLEEELCIGCELYYVPVNNDCGHQITMGTSANDCKEYCLDAGKYRMTVLDEDGDPVTPGVLEAIIKISIMPGPAPVKV